jgi:hypothetical protein
MPSTDRKLELKAKTSVAQTALQAAVYAKGLIILSSLCIAVLAELKGYRPVAAWFHGQEFSFSPPPHCRR